MCGHNTTLARRVRAHHLCTVFAPILLDAHNPSPMTRSGNNTYLIASDDGTAVLVDAGVGHPQHLSAIDAQLSATGCRLDHVLVTHAHADHASGAPIVAANHPAAAFSKYPWPDEDARYGGRPHRNRLRLALDGNADRTPVVRQLRAVRLGELGRAGRTGEPLDRRERLHGHLFGARHVALWHQATATIFTGDLVILGGSVMIHWTRGGDLAQYLASLERLLTLQPRVLLPAHGPRIDDPTAVLNGYLEHRRMRERQVMDALRAGHRTVHSIAESIYDGLEPALLPAARENVRAHLEKLKRDGAAFEAVGSWTLS